MTKFYLGTHMVRWLGTAAFPLFVSRRRLQLRHSFPRARCSWALDSGGFTELSMHGQWTITPREYVREARRYQAEIGLLEWAAPMDWMCEPFIIAKTHASVQVHQRRTVRNYVGLMESAPDVPWIPVLQGWTIGDYHRMAGLIGYCWILFVRLAKLTHQHIKFPLYIMGAIMVYISWLTVHVCYGCFRHYAEWWSR